MNEPLVFGAWPVASRISIVPQLVSSTAVYVLAFSGTNVGFLRLATGRAAGSAVGWQPAAASAAVVAAPGVVAVVDAAAACVVFLDPESLPHAATRSARAARSRTRRRRMAVAG